MRRAESDAAGGNSPRCSSQRWLRWPSPARPAPARRARRAPPPRTCGAAPPRRPAALTDRTADIQAPRGRDLALNRAGMAALLKGAPTERTSAAKARPLIVSLPAPQGGFQRFALVDSPVMAPALARKHPEIKTYVGRGLDDPTATIRADLTPLGFHASVRSEHGVWYIDPVSRHDQSVYASYFGRDLKDVHGLFDFRDPQHDDHASADATAGRDASPDIVSGAVLRTYRLALVSDPSYATYFGAPNVTAAKVTLMNRVDQVYED